MSGWQKHQGLACALDIENIDTDQLIPARFMSTPRSEGYGRFLLHDMRFESDGAEISGFPINRHPDVSLLVTRRNFGSGSSREAAVYALLDFGIRAVIAPSFGDIFASNAVNNGLLPARISEEDTTVLIETLAETALDAQVDIEAKEISIGTLTIPFALSDAWAQKLMMGWDDVDLTQHHRPAIAAYRAKRAQDAPWVFPAPPTAGVSQTQS